MSQGSLFDDVVRPPAAAGKVTVPGRGAAEPRPAPHETPAARAPQRRTVVYTDGACRGNPGPGGWAWAVPGGPYAAGPEAHTTNQRMELRAALEAIRALDGDLEVVSDSTYVVNCFRDRWWAGWRKRGWKNAAKQPVANRDLWEPLVDVVLARGVTFRWVRGHSGDPMNELVDRLAVQASETQRPVSGTGADAG